MDSADLSLVETSDGLQVIFNGRPLYSDAPLRDARRKAEALPVQDDTLYLLLSPCAWHGVAEFLERLPESSAILAVEADPVLLELARRLLPDTLPAHRLALSGSDPASIESVVGDDGPLPLGQFRRVREMSLCRGSMAHRERYAEVQRFLDSGIRVAWQNRLTLSAMARLWVSNIFRNASLIRDPAEIPQTSKPVAVCGAGPSLDAALPLLASERERIFVLSVDTALPALHAHGLKPDAVVAIEGQFINTYDFLPCSGRDYLLIADLASAPAVVSLHDPSRVTWLSSRFADLALLNRVEHQLPVLPVPPRGSVGVTAVELACTIGSSHILLCGLDLAFEPGGSTHATGAPTHIARHTQSSRLGPPPPAELGGRWLKRTGVNAEVLTTLTLVGYSEQLRSIISGSGSDRTVAVEPIGLQVGARAVTIEEARTLVAGAAPVQSPARSEADRPAQGDAARRGSAVGSARGFLSNELALLQEFQRALELTAGTPGKDATRGDGAGSQLAKAFAPCDYVAAGFADYRGRLGEEDGEFIGRLRVAADYYRDRLERAVEFSGE